MDDNFKDLLADNAEIVIDSLLSNDILKEIPILGSSLKIIKGVKNLRDKAYLNKIKCFVENVGKINNKQKKTLVDASRKDQKSRAKFGDAIFTTIEQCDSLLKIEYLSIAFEAFLNKDFGESEMRLISHVIRNTFSDDLKYVIEEESPLYLENLVITGLAEMEFREMTIDMTSTTPKFHLSPVAIWLRLAWKKYKK